MQEFKQKNIERDTFLLAFLLVQPDNMLPGIQRPMPVLCTIRVQKNSLSREREKHHKKAEEKNESRREKPKEENPQNTILEVNIHLIGSIN